MKKMNRFAQMYKQRVIYILETPLTINDLRDIFDPDTVWIDVTEMNDVEVGYIQGVDESGNFYLKKLNDTELEEQSMTQTEIVRSILYIIKLKREKYLNKILRRLGYLGVEEILRYRYLEEKDILSESLVERDIEISKRILNYILYTNIYIEKKLINLNYNKSTDINRFYSLEFSDILKEFDLSEIDLT